MVWVAFGGGLLIGSVGTVVALGLFFMARADEIRIIGPEGDNEGADAEKHS